MFQVEGLGLSCFCKAMCGLCMQIQVYRDVGSDEFYGFISLVKGHLYGVLWVDFLS